ncbi:hypothetical protein DAEQUDRAFT_392715 [Daedalea quercina L-15889]|uniref:Uncharacterized protein n=1 Tax=Daedalea quercina L-15889 TaxID=1314783 RepID=A0A165NW88_9APHY|nr:hypothetical protein DAEQUDRAFT_392715 [Daedalea quercina L-15889]
MACGSAAVLDAPLADCGACAHLLTVALVANTCCTAQAGATDHRLITVLPPSAFLHSLTAERPNLAEAAYSPPSDLLGAASRAFRGFQLAAYLRLYPDARRHSLLFPTACVVREVRTSCFLSCFI